MSALHVIAGARGGQATLQRYGLSHFSDIGKLGGRPTWMETLEKDQLARDKANKRSRSRNNGGG
ncbi:hypothetical protein [Candidatus Magnetobacterium casense]|uniref:Uncharacterized protein n=1 Tax=Candidatus Magnetobacterium casense TaxID=1455061 RepID=A0ABS6RXV0_9BACT|nr:hypothetical protein [Candidatus Magnetobacterium casensis]MBV6341464.1 hypothetical protein [Candidatus Magnetobacterium casensis]